MPTRAPRTPNLRDDLTARQREVLRLIAKGQTNFEIAQELGITLEGAKYHVSEILARLGVDSREDAAAWWRREQRPAARLRRDISATFSGTAFRIAAAAVGLTAVGVAALLAVIALRGGDDSTPAGVDPTPVVPASGCDAIIEGTFVIPASEGDTLRCVHGSGSTGTPVRRELDLTPGLFRQSEIPAGTSSGGMTWDQPGILYEMRTPGTQDWREAFRLRSTQSRTTLIVISAPGAATMDGLPGPAMRWADSDWKVVRWVEPTGVYQFEAGPGFSLEETLPWLVWFDRTETLRWNPATQSAESYGQPVWLLDPGTTVGVAAVDATIAAVRNGDAAAFLDLVHTVQVPCVADPAPGIIRPPACGPGQPAGTLVDGYLMGCVDTAGGVSTDSAYIFESFMTAGIPAYPYLVASPGPGRYVAVITNGEKFRTLFLDDEGVIGTGSCDPPQLQDELARVTIVAARWWP